MAPPRTTRKRKSDQFLQTQEPIDAETPEDAKRQKKLPVRAKAGEAADAAAAPVAAASGKVTVFTDDNEVDASPVVPLAPVARAEEAEDEDEEDSDDEAPEAVSTTKVASEMRKSAGASQKLAQEQAAAQKRKRQQRDALFKQQAEERKKVQDEEAAAKALAAADASDDDEAAPTNALGRLRRRGDKLAMSNVLPAEFLTDSSSEDESEGKRMTAAARSKKRKTGAVERVIAREGRGPKDEVVGSTVYRVAKKVDESMAPKARKHAKGTREALLRRNRSAGPARSRGFFAK